jgi:hypothetical protein
MVAVYQCIFSLLERLANERKEEIHEKRFDKMWWLRLENKAISNNKNRRAKTTAEAAPLSQ